MSERWRIVIGSDDAGLAYKDALTADLEADPRVTEVIDVGALKDESPPYVRVALAAARVVTEGRADRALLICGAGLGVAMSANKVPGIRAVTASDSPSVARSVLDNHAQVLCLGHRVISLDLARRLAREWLGYRFESRSAANVTVIGTFEDDIRPGPPTSIPTGLHRAAKPLVMRARWWTRTDQGVMVGSVWSAVEQPTRPGGVTP